MGKLILFMHCSLDGFCAGPNGEMNWIKVNDEIFGYVEKTIEKTDTALYGRVTYDMMEAYWPVAADKPNATKHDVNHAKWYMKSHKAVLSKTMEHSGNANVQIISDDVVNEINALKQSSEKDILLFGSPTAAHALLAEDLFDGYWLIQYPVTIGTGIPVFKNNTGKTNLALKTSHVFSSGVIGLYYEKVQ